MMHNSLLVMFLVKIVLCENCYWNNQCTYQLYSTKTPYDAVRGDIRDYKDLDYCEPLSLWSINRHGNRNPGTSDIPGMKFIASLKDEIIASHEAGQGQLCAQDIEELRKWTWNDIIDTTASYLTGTGFDELIGIGKRVREKFPQLLNGPVDRFYFRATSEQRTINSAISFVRGLTATTNLHLDSMIDAAREKDEVIRPYELCNSYQEEVKTAAIVDKTLADYIETDEYVAVQNRVQKRLGISTRLSPENIYSIYEMCRYYRSWSVVNKSPWCAAFTDEDLVVLEYRDDIRHYYRNGYGSWINERLGGTAMKDLYESFQRSVQGEGLNIVAYFTHDTMLDMVFCSLGMFRDDSPLLGTYRNVSRLWRTSNLACFSNNLMAVLYRCQESGSETHKVQIFHNERPAGLCPINGCTWDQFSQKFQKFADVTLDFCDPSRQDYTGNGAAVRVAGIVVQLIFALIWLT